MWMEQENPVGMERERERERKMAGGKRKRGRKEERKRGGKSEKKNGTDNNLIDLMGNILKKKHFPIDVQKAHKPMEKKAQLHRCKH